MGGPTRREFSLAPFVVPRRGRHPNVIVLISDDQGFGDLSLHANPHLQTPNLDSIAKGGVQFTQFHSSPVCSPTRASLMTARWNYRTGVVDTYLGRSLMRPDEVTLAECLKNAGYATGIFGKWHLGDCYPLRAIDQGFTSALTLRGGGLAQPSGPPGEGYFDPQLERDGIPTASSGYCTDIFFDAAMEFIERRRNQPFFAYIATNAPHTPLQVDDRWAEPFRNRGLDDATGKIYGMVSNLDHNTGRLLQQLQKLQLEKDTVLIFLTDNGPQQSRYNAGMRGLKGSVYQGGIRVPCFMRWPRRIPAGRTVDWAAAHVDLMPTILEACGVPLPRARQIDGRSLLALAEGKSPGWTDRHLFFQWHRGDVPEAWKNCAVRSQRWKLVNGSELYDLESDPEERQDVAPAQAEVVAKMRAAYEEWFEDVGRPGYDPPRIHIGSARQQVVLLTRQDWRGPTAGWDDRSLGYYEVEVLQPGPYEVELRFPPAPAAGKAELEFRGIIAVSSLSSGESKAIFSKVRFPPGAGRIEARIRMENMVVGAHYVQIRPAGVPS